jgi:hypothetical protein
VGQARTLALVWVGALGLALACAEEGGTAGPPDSTGGSGGSGAGTSGDGSLCWAGTEQCGSTCIDVSKDPANCGHCGKICSAGEVCSLGTCAVECGGGTRFCGSFCVNVEIDPAHCGACDAPCASGQLCAGGSCVAQCPGKLVPCLGGCVDTAQDPKHCGACGAKCAVGGCAGGTCHCGDGAQNGNETGVDCGGSCLPCQQGGGCKLITDCVNGLSCTAGTCWVAPPLDSALVGFWRFEGNAQDASGNGNHGTLHGVTSTTGKLGKGYQISEGSCIAVPDSSSLDMVGASGFSLLAWIQNAGGCSSDRGIVLNKEETYELGIECSQNLLQEALQLSDGIWFWSGTAPVTTDGWHHVAVTWDGATVRHYLDGAEVFTRALAGSFADRATGLGIGCRSVPPDASGPGGSFFAGVIDEVAVYSRGLSAAEVQGYYQTSK